MSLRTYAKIENGVEVAQIVLKPGEPVPDGDWRPVVVEGFNIPPGYIEVRRDTRIDPDKVVRVVVTAPVPPPSREQYGAAVEAHVDAVARSRGYSGAVSMLTYLNSNVPSFAADAVAMRNWRDAVWVTVSEIEAEVLAGQRQPPTVSDLVAALPAHPFGA